MPTNQLPLLPLILDDVPPGLRLALAQEGVPFRLAVGGSAQGSAQGPAQGRFLLFDSCRGPCPPLAAGQKPIDVNELRQPHAEVDLFEALSDQTAAQLQWKIAGITLEEEAARFDKRGIRRELMARLRRVIEGRGGIWLRISAFPFPYRSAFNFRIDYDEFDREDFNATLDAIEGHEEASSHFINAATHAHAGQAWQRFRGLDVGSHGYWHHTYRTEQENLHNIRRGIEAIESHGIATSGFTAPAGRFNPGLQAAMAKLKISHSSEFALAYDELPFSVSSTDPVQSPENAPLQIPVHPVCLGLFLEAAKTAGRSQAASNSASSSSVTSSSVTSMSSSSEKARQRAAVRAAIEHFTATARQRYRAGEPVFLYGHPTGRLGRYPQVLHELFATVDDFAAIWPVTMTQFADWWRARLAARLSVTRRGEQFVVAAKDISPRYRFGIEYFRDRHVALMPMGGPTLSFSPGALAYENRDAKTSFRPVRVDRPHGLKNHIRRFIDWELVTPVDEIATPTWRHHAKRALRRWWRP